MRSKLGHVVRAGIIAGLGLWTATAVWRHFNRGPGPLPTTSPHSASLPPAESFRPDSERQMRGGYVFERNCAICHGRWGDGRGEMAEGMQPKPGNLTLGYFKFRSTPTGFLPTDEDLGRTVRRGIANSSMPSFAHLPAREVEAVIAYLKTLSPRWRRPENYSGPFVIPSEPEWLYDERDSKPHRDAGARLFGSNCAPCHGVAADGQCELASRLENQLGEPCPPPDLRNDPLKNGPELTDWFRVLTTGMDGTPMPSFGEGFSEEDRWDLVAYLRDLRRQGVRDKNLPPGTKE